MCVCVCVYYMLRRAAASGAAAAAVGGGYLWAASSRHEAAREPGGAPRALRAGEALYCTLTEKQWVTPSAVRLRFALPSAEHVLGLPVPGHVMVIDDAQIYRPYSPVTVDSQAAGYFELLVRHYPGGEISTRLAKMSPGERAHFRGPVGNAFEYTASAAPRRIGMVAGGTGVTPLWQVVQAALADEEDRTRLSLVYASRRADDILLRDELERAAAAHPDRFSVCFVVSEGGGAPAGGVAGRIDAAVLQRHLPQPSEDGSGVLVCGPDSMLRALCGPRARDGGLAEAARRPPLGGLLRQLGYEDWQVCWL